MKRFALVVMGVLMLLVGIGAAAGYIAASGGALTPPAQVQVVERLIPDTPVLPEPSLSVSSDDDSPPLPPEKPDIQYPNLGYALDQVATAAENEESSSREAGGDTAGSAPEPVAVSIYLSGHVDDVVAFLEDNGGDPRNVGEDYIEAYVPVSLLGELSGQPGLLRVREIIPQIAN